MLKFLGRRCLCDPPAILVRSRCILCDPGAATPNFYMRSCETTCPFYSTKKDWGASCASFAFSGVSLPRPSRILPRPSKGQWLQTSCFAFLFGGRWQWRESSQRKRGPRHCNKVVAGKLNLNSSLTDSVRLELQVQFASSHFQLALRSVASAPLA